MYKIFPPLPFLSGAGCRGGEGEKYLNFPRRAINNSEQESVITWDLGQQLSSLQLLKYTTAQQLQQLQHLRQESKTRSFPVLMLSVYRWLIFVVI